MSHGGYTTEQVLLAETGEGGEMTDKEMLAECLDLLEQWLDGDEPRKVTKKMVDLLTARFTRHKPTFKPELTSKYEIAKDCVAEIGRAHV